MNSAVLKSMQQVFLYIAEYGSAIVFVITSLFFDNIN